MPKYALSGQLQTNSAALPSIFCSAHEVYLLPLNYKLHADFVVLLRHAKKGM